MKATRVAGSSIGDRACLLLGLKTGLPVVATERAWAKADVEVSVEVIR